MYEVNNVKLVCKLFSHSVLLEVSCRSCVSLFQYLFLCPSVILLIRCSSVSQFTHLFSFKWTILVN